MHLNGTKKGRSGKGTPRETAPTRDSVTRKALGDGGSLLNLSGAGKSRPDKFAKYKKGI